MYSYCANHIFSNKRSNTRTVIKVRHLSPPHFFFPFTAFSVIMCCWSERWSVVSLKHQRYLDIKTGLVFFNHFIRGDWLMIYNKRADQLTVLSSHVKITMHIWKCVKMRNSHVQKHILCDLLCHIYIIITTF